MAEPVICLESHNAALQRINTSSTAQKIMEAALKVGGVRHAPHRDVHVIVKSEEAQLKGSTPLLLPFFKWHHTTHRQLMQRRTSTIFSNNIIKSLTRLPSSDLKLLQDQADSDAKVSTT
jgi:hypothetical protein